MCPELLIALNVDSIGAVVEIEIVDILRPQEDGERVGDFADRQTQTAGSVAIDGDQKLRIVPVKAEKSPVTRPD